MEAEKQTQGAYRWFRISIAAYLFVLVLALTPWTPDPAGDVKRLLLAVFSASLATAWLAASWRMGVPVRRPRIVLEVLLGMLVCYGAATFRSPYPGFSITELAFFGGLFLLYFVASQVYTKEQEVLGLMKTLCAAMVLAALYAFLQKSGLDPFPWTGREQDIYTNLPSTFGNPNYAAHTLVLALIMAVLLARHTADRRVWAVAALFALYLYFTGQRGGIIGLGAAAVLLLMAGGASRLFSGAIKRVVVALLVTALAGAAAGGLYMLQNKARNGVALPLDGSLLLRYNGYLNSAAMILDRPLLGHGPGVYALTTPVYWTTFEQQWFAQEQLMNAHVHNDLLEVAVDAGLPAAGFYLALLLLGICYGLLMAFTAPDTARRRLGFAFAALFMTFLVDGLFGFNLRVPVSASVLFVLLGSLEGLWVSPDTRAAPLRKPGLPGVAWRLGMAGAAVIIAVWGARVFLSEFMLQRGLKHHHLMMKVFNAPPQEKRDMDPQKAAAFVEAQRAAAKSAFTWGERLAPWNYLFGGRIGETEAAARAYDDAARHFERALALNPYYVPTLARLAGTRLTQAEDALGPEGAAPAGDVTGLLDEALHYADRIGELCPVFALAEELKGRIACLRAKCLARRDPPADGVEVEEQWKQGEAHLERAIQLGARNHIELYRLLAQVRETLADPEGAEEAFVRAVQSNPDDADLWEMFFSFAMRAEVSERIKNTLNTLIAHIVSLEPPRHDAVANGYIALARCFAETKDLAGADDAIASAARYGTGQEGVWRAFAQYANEHDRLFLYERCLRDAVQQAAANGAPAEPALAIAHLLLAEMYEGKTPPADAAAIEAAYQQAVRFAADRADVWANYANFARRNDRMETFKETLKTTCNATRGGSVTPPAFVHAVSNVIEQGPAALELSTSVLLRQFREYPSGNVRLVTVHLSWAAQLLFEAAVNAQGSEPTLCRTWLNLAIVLAGMEQYTAAESLYPRAMQCLEGENTAIAGIQWADTLQRMGRTPEALNLLRDLLARFPDMPELRHAHAQTLVRNQQIPEALQEYDALLDVQYLPPNVKEQLEAERNALIQPQP